MIEGKKSKQLMPKGKDVDPKCEKDLTGRELLMTATSGTNHDESRHVVPKIEKVKSDLAELWVNREGSKDARSRTRGVKSMLV